MKMKRWILTLCICAAPFVVSAQPLDLTAEINALLSRLQSMGHGYYSEAEWNSIFDQINGMAQKAEAAQAWDTLVEVNLIKAMVLSDMIKDYNGAVTVLKDTKTRYAKLGAKNVGKVYVREAEVYSKIGDDEAIRELIAEFKASPYYDPENYSYSGGWGPSDPLTVRRPGSKGDDSVSVSTMEMYRNRARFAPGRYFPDFKAVDANGREISLQNYRGKVVLLDFWATGWEPWKRALPQLVSTYNRYASQGFEIIGINMERNPQDLKGFLKANDITWPQIVNDTKIAKDLGIFGEATSFLLDKNGQIVGRDLVGADLVEALKKTLSVQ